MVSACTLSQHQQESHGTSSATRLKPVKVCAGQPTNLNVLRVTALDTCLIISVPPSVAFGNADEHCTLMTPSLSPLQQAAGANVLGHDAPQDAFNQAEGYRYAAATRTREHRCMLHAHAHARSPAFLALAQFKSAGITIHLERESDAGPLANLTCTPLRQMLPISRVMTTMRTVLPHQPI